MPEADATEPFVEPCQLLTWIVGADSIRPQQSIPFRGALCRVDYESIPTVGCAFIEVLSKIWGFGRMRSAPTV